MEFIFRTSIKRKLMIAFFVLITVPISINSLISYYRTVSYIENKSTAYARKITEQIGTSVDIYLKQIDKLSIQTSYSEYTLGLLNKKYEDLDQSLYEYSVDRVNSNRYLLGMLRAADGVESIFIYNKDNRGFLATVMGEVNVGYSIKDQDWYEEVLDLNGTRIFLGPHKEAQLKNTNETVISLVRKVRDLKKLQGIGISVVNVNVSIFGELLKNMDSGVDSDIYILDSHGSVVYCNTGRYKVSDAFEKMIFEQISEDDYGTFEEKFHSEPSLVTYSTSRFTGWKIVSITAKRNLTAGVDIIKTTSIIVGISLALLALLLSIFISNGIVKPIQILKKMIGKIENGDFDQVIELDTKDEIGSFARSFNRMTLRLKQLVNEIYVKENEKRKAQIAVLQSQIHPHFIYNTLSTVKYMATIQKSTGIVNMIDALIKLFQAYARQEGDLVTIEEELKLLRSYIYIQEIRYYSKFKVEFDYDESVLSFKTLSFILQPLVENAIFHGIEPKGGKGVIKIIIRHINDHMEFIVEDDGIGMTRDKIFQVMNRDSDSEKDSASIGVFNVDRRIKLFFSEDYGIKIESCLNTGTRVFITIPAMR